jgi:hypothetical protein
MRASGIARRRTEEERAEAFFLCERRRRRRIHRAMREQLETQMRASGIARRRTEEERAEAFFLCERRRRRRIHRAMREQLETQMITTRPRCQTPMCTITPQATQWRTPAGRSARRSGVPGPYVLGMQIPAEMREHGRHSAAFRFDPSAK